MNGIIKKIKKHKSTYIMGGVIGILVVAIIILLAEDRHYGHNSFAQPELFGGGRMATNFAMNMEAPFRAETAMMEDSIIIDEALPVPPTEPSGGYGADLEKHETTDYSVNGRIAAFDAACEQLGIFKANDSYHFRYLNESLNACSAEFFVPHSDEALVASELRAIEGLAVSRATRSVTRHKEQLDSRATVLAAQLASVEQTLQEAERGFDEIITFAKTNRDAEVLADAVSEKLRLVDDLTRRKISLSSQLDNLYQQATDLRERQDVVTFSVHVSRAVPIVKNQTANKWREAWRDVEDTVTDTLIGVSAFFLIFLLWGVRIVLYLAAALIALRLLWKFVRQLWKI